MAFWIATALLILLTLLFMALATWRKLAMFLSELRRIRIADDLDEVTVREVASKGPAYGDLREASGLLLAAEGSFRNALRRVRWEVVGLGNPDLRQLEIATACGQLLQAQAAIRQANLKLSATDIEADQDIPVVHDPVRALAARGRWVTWGLFTLAPRFIRGIYGFRTLSRQLKALMIVNEELLEQVDGQRKTVEPAPVRRAPLAARAVFAA